MRHLALLLLAAGLLADEPQFGSLDEAKEAVLGARTLALSRQADGARNDGLRAWRDRRFDDASAAFERAFDLYPKSLDRAKDELAALPAVKKPAGIRTAPQRAIDSALAWLSAHQDPIGRFDVAGFMKHDPADDKCDGAGEKDYDVGVTALAALAFLESGAPATRPEVHRALQWLRAQQDEDGVLGRKESFQFIYNHAIATYALATAYDPRFEKQLKPALDYLLMAQSPGKGWRYDPHDGEADTSVTCWCYRALAAAAKAGIELDLATAQSGTRAWVHSVTAANGVTGYNLAGGAVARPGDKGRFEPDLSRAMTAAGVVLRLLVDDPPDRKLLLKSLDQCLERPPVWNPDTGSIDMYYWYYGTLACAADKTRARKWKKPLLDAVLKHQHPSGSGARTGSFDPIGVWGAEGGRVYSTAILALALAHAD